MKFNTSSMQLYQSSAPMKSKPESLEIAATPRSVEDMWQGTAHAGSVAGHARGRRFYRRIGKRWIDVCLTAPALIVMSPLFILCGLLIKLISPGPVFFRQNRVGLGGRRFSIFKFRTMIENAECQGLLITAKDDRRVTRLGSLMRRLKIDELPQLWNVLKGEMSLVGPRPEVPEFVQTYTPDQRTVLSVRPGITDLASIKYLDEEKVLAAAPDPAEFYRQRVLPQKLQLNLEYIKRVSFSYDLSLILKTIGLVFFPAFLRRKPVQ